MAHSGPDIASSGPLGAELAPGKDKLLWALTNVNTSESLTNPIHSGGQGESKKSHHH